MSACFCCVRFSFLHTKPRDWFAETSLKRPILRRVGRKTTISQSFNQYCDLQGCYGDLHWEAQQDWWLPEVHALLYPLVYRFLTVLHCNAHNICHWHAPGSCSGRVISASDRSVRGPRFESHRRRLCLSRQPLRYTALGTGCTPLPQCLGRLSLPPSVRR